MSLFSGKKGQEVRGRRDAIDSIRVILREGGVSGIPLPSIVVIGDQSVGKTTVLELLSGIQLPRGDGIVTRCPLELRLHELEDEGEPYALISSAEHDERRCSLGEVERVVVEMTNELAGTSLSVVDKPIYVSVYRQDVLDLTVIDLPGLVSIAREGQAQTIVADIEAMVRRYGAPDEAVILCACAANRDLATNDAIGLARELDESGRRTIGVITKADLATPAMIRDVGQDGGDVFGFALGCVAVRASTADERAAGATREDMSGIERHLFDSPAWQEVPDRCRGIQALAHRLQDIQLQSIDATLPRIRSIIAEKQYTVREELIQIPPSMSDDAVRSLALIKAASDIQSRLEVVWSGVGTSKGEKNAPARLANIRDTFCDRMMAMNTCLSADYGREIAAELEEARGISLDNFVSSHVFKRLVVSRLAGLREVCLELCDVYHDYTRWWAGEVFSEAAQDIPHRSFCGFAKAELFGMLERSLELVRSRAIEMFEAESAQPITLNSFYMNAVNRVTAYLELLRSGDAKAANAAGDILVAMGIHLSDLPTLAGVGADQGRLTVQISMFAYMEVVTHRVMDAVVLLLNYHLPVNLSRNLRDTICERANKVGLENVFPLDSRSEDRRHVLQSRLEALNEAELKIRPFCLAGQPAQQSNTTTWRRWTTPSRRPQTAGGDADAGPSQLAANKPAVAAKSGGFTLPAATPSDRATKSFGSFGSGPGSSATSSETPSDRATKSFGSFGSGPAGSRKKMGFAGFGRPEDSA